MVKIEVRLRLRLRLRLKLRLKLRLMHRLRCGIWVTVGRVRVTVMVTDIVMV